MKKILLLLFFASTVCQAQHLLRLKGNDTAQNLRFMYCDGDNVNFQNQQGYVRSVPVSTIESLLVDSSVLAKAQKCLGRKVAIKSELLLSPASLADTSILPPVVKTNYLLKSGNALITSDLLVVSAVCLTGLGFLVGAENPSTLRTLGVLGAGMGLVSFGFRIHGHSMLKLAGREWK